MKSIFIGVLIGILGCVIVLSPEARDIAFSHRYEILIGIGIISLPLILPIRRIKRRLKLRHSLNSIRKNIQDTEIIKHNGNIVTVDYTGYCYGYTITVTFKDFRIEFRRDDILWYMSMCRKTKSGKISCKINDAILDQMVVLVSICADSIKNKMNQNIDEITSELKELNNEKA